MIVQLPNSVNHRLRWFTEFICKAGIGNNDSSSRFVVEPGWLNQSLKIGNGESGFLEQTVFKEPSLRPGMMRQNFPDTRIF